MSKHRFKVIEYSSNYAVLDTWTDQEAEMGDGVDTLFTATGKAMTCGTEYFRQVWEKSLNETPDETLEAYFYEQWEKEQDEWLGPMEEKQ